MMNSKMGTFPQAGGFQDFPNENLPPAFGSAQTETADQMDPPAGCEAFLSFITTLEKSPFSLVSSQTALICFETVVKKFRTFPGAWPPQAPPRCCSQAAESLAVPALSLFSAGQELLVVLNLLFRCKAETMKEEDPTSQKSADVFVLSLGEQPPHLLRPAGLGSGCWSPAP